MTREERVLLEALKVWEDQAAAAENEVRLGVDRAVRRLRQRKHASMGPRVWALSGTVAAFMATLAYAGRGTFVESSSQLVALRTTAAADGRPAQPPGVSSPAGGRAASRDAVAALAGDSDPAARGARDRWASPERALATEVSGSASLPATGVALAVPEVTAPTVGSARFGSAGAQRSMARAGKRHAKGLDGSASRGGVVGPGRAGSGSHADGAARGAGGAASAARAAAAGEPSWSDVNEALAAHDRGRASELLASLAERGGSADTRAKAQLGIAQLEAGGGNCEKGRRLALEVAARPGIEIKTVRRALELAARCAK